VIEPTSSPAAIALEHELVSQYGEGQRSRITRGIRQVSEYWRPSDGNSDVLEQFVRDNFAGTQEKLDAVFLRFERLLEQLEGHMHEISREFRQQADLDLGPLLPVDETFAGYDPSAHLLDDLFGNKLAFVVLLNFPLTTLEERLRDGRHWTRRQWAEARLAQRFSKRVPGEVSLAIAQAAAESDQYVTRYNIWMYHLLDNQGQRLFPPKLRLLSHWNLRDQIKADYAHRENGLERQRIIQRVMERIVTQSIPKIVIDNPDVDWNPFTNEVVAAAVHDSESPSSKPREVSDAPESSTRYAMLQKTFSASRKLDPYSPTAPTLLARRFDEDREIPEARAKRMLEQVVSSPLVPKVAKLIQSRLNRPLEPFDIWYDGFRPRPAHTEAELNALVASKYPDAEAFRRDIPRLLTQLGFSQEKAEYLAAYIEVDPGRGAGHATGAEMRTAKAHLRTRIEKSGMNYKGFNVAAHELGHNVEQVLTLNDMDHWLLRGVPNTAFTEAFAFIFQARDLELLGLAAPDESTAALKTLQDFWLTYEICGVALVDIAVWHWMYDHPNARPEELRNAVLEIAKDIWNRYYAPVFGMRDVVLLAVYSHMIDSFLYLPDYPIGHMIAHQIEEQIKKAGSVGEEFERMVKPGRVSPDLWMENATGRPVGPEALLEAAGKSCELVASNS
jgi:hypothetical protein